LEALTWQDCAQVENAAQSDLITQLIVSEDKLQGVLVKIDALQGKNYIMNLEHNEVKEQRRLLNSALTGSEHSMKVKLMEIESLKAHAKQLGSNSDHLGSELATVKLNRDRMKAQLAEVTDALQKANADMEVRSLACIIHIHCVCACLACYHAFARAV
jgi:chromosome segregation ATPase